MNPFKGSSNKLGLLGICGPPLGVARVGIAARYIHPSRKGNIPSCAIKVTTNKLEKVLIISKSQSHIVLTAVL